MNRTLDRPSVRAQGIARIAPAWRAALALGIAACPWPSARALEIYVCRDADGMRHYQDQACAPNSTASAVLELADHPLDAPSLQAQRVARATREIGRENRQRIQTLERRARLALPESLGGTSRAMPTGRIVRRPDASPSRAARMETACAVARAQREKAYRDRGHTMGFDERRRLQDTEVDACGLL